MHRLPHSLSLPKWFALLSWYGLTRCNTVSSFHGKGEKSALETWKCYPKATEIFVALSNPVDGVLTENSISAIERIICLMYHKTTFISNVNDCLSKKSKAVDNMPSKNALIQHLKREVYQGG